MPKFAANISLLFTEHAFQDRFEAAADAGFSAVECLFPYELSANVFAHRLARNRLTPALFNMPPGDWAAGERGLAAIANRFDEFRQDVARALDYAAISGAKRIHMMAGLADSRDAQAQKSYIRALTYAADAAAATGVDILIEPINARSMPGYFLDDFGLAEQIIAKVGRTNVKLQFDVFHRQIMHGDVTMAFRRLLPLIGHVQIASIPSRHEPDGEEMNYPYLFAEIDASGYDGFVGCEYYPRQNTLAGLGWFKRMQGQI